MGEQVARAAGFDVTVVSAPADAATSGADTRIAAEAMRASEIDLLLFAGGDGTARDIFEAIGARVPVLGIPAGVKMHSAVFATSAACAGEVAGRYLRGERSVALEAAEVMDREIAQGQRASPRLFGFARSPRASLLTQYAKSIAHVDDDGDLRAACRYAANLARDDALTILGPGTTTQIVRQHLGFDGTVDGVDLVLRGRPLALDVSESQLLDALSSASAARIIVSIVGGQGYLFGRGNQQISAAVIRRVGRQNIVVVAAKSKLLALGEQCLFVDTAAPDVDVLLAGYTHVWTSGRERMVYRVHGGSGCAPAS
jgi:predicted polyphosphate/ATP-dependent NAD kinase